MPNFLRIKLAIVLFIGSLPFLSPDAYSQSCSFPGSPPDGGPTRVTNGQPCANLNSPGVIKIEATNINDGNSPFNFGVYIEWDDGTTETITYPSGGIVWGGPGSRSYVIPSIPHVFPTTGADVKCIYKPRIFLRIAGNTCPTPFGDPPSFIRWNFDDENSGELELSETTSGATVYEVCQGAATTVTFTDRTTLNCVPPEFNDIPNINNFGRWRRFTYNTNASTITGVTVGGTPVTPGVPLVRPVLASNEPILVPFPPHTVTTESITIPATAVAGQYFDITMDYWNTCNPFPANQPRQFSARILVVAQPAAPTPTNHEVCSGANLSSAPLSNQFRVNFAGASDRVFWYRDNAGVRGTSVSNPRGNNSKTFPIGSFPGGINANTPGVYRMWVSYRRPGAGGTPACESIAVPVTLTVRRPVPTPGPFTTATSSVCNGSTNVEYQLATAATALTPGGNTEYEYEVTDASNNPVGDVTLALQPDGRTWRANFNVVFSGSTSSTIRKIRVRRKYTSDVTSPNPISSCPTPYYEYPVTVFRQTDAGSIAGGDIKCYGAVLADITWNPGIGDIVRWERSDNNGVSWATVPSFGTNPTVNPTTLSYPVLPGSATYLFRAQIQNGVCAVVPTGQVSYIINPNTVVANAGPDDNLCINAGPLQFTLAGNSPGAATGTWSYVSGPGATNNPALASIANPNLNNSQVIVTNPGNYIFKWVINNGSCDSEDFVEISFGRNPTTPVPTSNSFCGLTGTLDAVAAVYEDVEWTYVAGSGPVGSIVTIGSPNSIPSPVSVLLYGTYQFRLTFRSGSCPTTPSAVATITFTEPVAANAGLDDIVCADGNAIAVVGNVSGGQGTALQRGRWEPDGANASGAFTSGGGFTTGPSIPGGYQPVAADYTRGHVILRLVAEDPDGLGDCVSATSSVRIDFDLLPAAADAGVTGPTCSADINLNAAAPTNNGIGTWTVVAGSSNIIDPTLSNTQVTGLIANAAPGTNVFRWTVNSLNGQCAPTSDDVDVVRVPPPTINSLNPQLCETVQNSGTQTNVDLSSYSAAITGAGIDLKWYTNAARTAVFEINPATLRPISNGTTFFLRASNVAAPFCSSDDVITFTVNPKPFIANVIPSICEEVYNGGEVNNVDLTTFNNTVAVTNTGRTVEWFIDNSFSTPVITPVNNVTNGTVFFARVTNTSTGCFNMAEAVYEVNEIPDPNPIVGANNICFDPDEVHFFKVQDFKPNFSYQWTIPGSVTNVTGIDNDFFVTLQFPTVVPGGVDFEVLEISDKGCSNVPIPHHVDIEGQFSGLTIVGPNEVCEGEENVTFTTDNFPYTFQWTVPPGASIISGQGSNSIDITFGPGGGSGVIAVSPSTTIGCVGPGTTVPVTINTKPVMAPNLDRTICSDELAATLILNTSGTEPAVSYNIVTRVNSAGLTQRTGAIIPPAINAAADNVLTDQSFENITGGPLNVRYTVEPVSAKGCVGNRSVVTLTVNPEPQLDLALSKALCSDEETGIVLRPAVGSVSADQYIINGITNPDNLVGSNVPVFGMPLSNQAIIANSWNNPGGGVTGFSTIEYSITPRNSGTGCLGDPPSPLAIRIFPKPIFEPIANTPICSGEAQNIILTTNNVPSASIVSTLELIDANISGASSNVYNAQPALINEVLLNTSSSSAGIVQYRIIAENAINASKTCASAPLTVQVQVNPVPVGNILPPLQVCSTIPNSGVYTATLADLVPLVTVPTNNVLWFQDDPSVNASPIQILTPMTNVQHLVPIYAQITNASSCNTVVPVIHNVNNAVTLSLDEFDVTCNGAQNGRIAATAAFGTAPFSFRRGTDPFVTSLNNQFDFNSLAAGQYNITVMDSKGCMATLASDIIVEPTPLIILSTTSKPVDCFYDLDNAGKNRNAEITVTASGGSGNYRFSLSPNNIQPASVTASSAVFNNLNSGTYVIRVEEFSNSSCKTESLPIPLDPPTALEFSSVTVTTDPVTQMQISCRGADNGEITVLATGGAQPYNYYLNPFTGGPLPGTTNQQVKFDFLSAGNYSLRVEDAKGCKALATANIRDVPELFPGRIGSDQNVCLSDLTPAGNAATLTELIPVFGGSSQYEYVWEQSSDKTNWFTTGVTTNTFDPDANGPFTLAGPVYYRRLVRNVVPQGLDDTPSYCADYKGQTDIVTINVRDKPAAIIIAPPFICKDGNGDVRLQLVGTAPMQFNYSDGVNVFVGERGGQESIPYQLLNFQAATTVRFTNIKDAFGCTADNVEQLIDLAVADASFTIDDPERCANEAFQFSINNPQGGTYFWNVGDGTPIAPTLSDSPLSHTYNPALSAQGDVSFQVRLRVDFGQCTSTTEQTVKVLRSVIPNIIQPSGNICSGESVTFTDNSSGVTGGRWFWVDRLGNVGPDVPVGNQLVTFTLDNTTTENPLEYDVFYEPIGNPACPVPAVQMQTVRVYRNPEALFVADPSGPPIIGGLVTTTLTNTTTPLDADDFDYEWEYDDINATIIENGYDRTVTYANSETHQVVLTVKNKLNPGCSDVYSFEIIPNLGNPNAAFRANLAGCFPFNLDVKNLSTGYTTFEWKLTSTNGTDERSTLRQPDFRITEPGTYQLILIAGRAPDVEVTDPKIIEVFDVPVADFDLRQSTVFVNEEVKPVNRSRYAQEFYWEFGDGFTSTLFEPRHFYTLEGRDSIMLVASFNHGDRDVDDDPSTPAVPVVCADTTKVPVRIIEGGALKIPNAFTPNVNGPNGGTPDNNFTNDVFLPIMEGVQEFNMQIFDRWGTLVFQSSDKNIGWDGYDRNGRLMPAGVYVFKVVLRLGDGQRTTKVGDVTLIR